MAQRRRTALQHSAGLVQEVERQGRTPQRPELPSPLAQQRRERLVAPAKGQRRHSANSAASTGSDMTSLGSEGSTRLGSRRSDSETPRRSGSEEPAPAAEAEAARAPSAQPTVVRVYSEGASAQRRRPVLGFLHQHLDQPLAHAGESTKKDLATQGWLGEIVSEATLAFAPAARAAIVQACHLRQVAEGEVLAREGEHVDRHMPGLCILEQGQVRVHQSRGCYDGLGPVVKTYSHRGDVVEEMASVHGAGRLCTVVAQEASSVWCANRDALVRAQVRSANEGRDFLLQSIDRVELFSPLDVEARARLVDSLTEVTFNAGEMLIAEGAEEAACYFVVQGRAATKRGRVLLHEMRPGSVFNELALIRQMVRASSVVAVTDLVCAVIHRETFNRVIGSQEELREHAATLYLSVAGTKGRKVSNESVTRAGVAEGAR